MPVFLIIIFGIVSALASQTFHRCSLQSIVLSHRFARQVWVSSLLIKRHTYGRHLDSAVPEESFARITQRPIAKFELPRRLRTPSFRCKSCFRIASASTCPELSSATASGPFRYAQFSLRKHNSRTHPSTYFHIKVFDAQMSCPLQGPKFSMYQCEPSRSKVTWALSYLALG